MELAACKVVLTHRVHYVTNRKWFITLPLGILGFVAPIFKVAVLNPLIFPDWDLSYISIGSPHPYCSASYPMCTRSLHGTAKLKSYSLHSRADGTGLEEDEVQIQHMIGSQDQSANFPQKYKSVYTLCHALIYCRTRPWVFCEHSGELCSAQGGGGSKYLSAHHSVECFLDTSPLTGKVLPFSIPQCV
jgi:hypothetical protein